MDDPERMATAHHMLISAEEDAIARGVSLPAAVSAALDLLSGVTPVLPAYTYRAAGTRVIDGDTFVAAVDLGFHVTFNCVVRLHGINAPEKGKAGAAAATHALEQLVLGRRLLLESYKDERSFERWVCDVWNVESEARNVAQELVTGGWAKPFAKGEKWVR